MIVWILSKRYKLMYDLHALFIPPSFYQTFGSEKLIWQNHIPLRYILPKMKQRYNMILYCKVQNPKGTRRLWHRIGWRTSISHVAEGNGSSVMVMDSKKRFFEGQQEVIKGQRIVLKELISNFILVESERNDGI